MAPVRQSVVKSMSCSSLAKDSSAEHHDGFEDDSANHNKSCLSADDDAMQDEDDLEDDGTPKLIGKGVNSSFDDSGSSLLSDDKVNTVVNNEPPQLAEMLNSSSNKPSLKPKSHHF